MLREAETRQALACIRCGACLNACPVYQQIGGHAYGAVYGGPIGSIITPQIDGLHMAHHLPFASSLCGACRDVCPVKIDIPRALTHLRRRVVNERRPAPRARPLVARTAFRGWRWSMTSARRYRIASALLRLTQRMGIASLFGPLRTWARGRNAPAVAKTTFREMWDSNRTLEK